MFLNVSAKARKLSRIENLKRRPTKRPDWNELMKESEGVISGVIRLKKTVSNDRSKPVLSKAKDRQGQVSRWLQCLLGQCLVIYSFFGRKIRKSRFPSKPTFPKFCCLRYKIECLILPSLGSLKSFLDILILYILKKTLTFFPLLACSSSLLCDKFS